MNKKKFPKFPANARHIAGRKRLYGIGINDAPYLTQPTVAGRRYCCPIYQIWADMLRRVYIKGDVSTIDEEWLTFMNFQRWVAQQDYSNQILNNTLLTCGFQRHYSETTCCFISKELHRLLLEPIRSRVGVDVHQNKYRAVYRGRYLGHFGSFLEANTKRQRARAYDIRRHIKTNTLLKNAILKYAQCVELSIES